MRRRRLLANLGGLAATTGLAGCLATPGDRTETPTPTASNPTPEPTDSSEHPVTPVETSFDVVGRSCGLGEHAAEVTFANGTVSVAGVIGGRDTCDTARLASTDLQSDVLEVVVAVVEEPHTATVACAQCLTDIEYAFSTNIEGSGPTQVRVVHETAEGRATVTVTDRS